ncbi:CapA family protein, partial [Enterocloster bolteae]|uniref:CapA family protein n=1 Tax=Enterocloster bolteae TaxID=208479 RepID=UPI0027BA66BE
MKRTGCIVAAALLLGLLLAGITGYFIWHSAQDKYVRAEMVGVSGGTGVAGVEAPEPEEGDGAETGAAADSDGAQGTDGLQGMDGAQGTDGPDAADGGLSAHSDNAEAQGPGTGTSDEDSPLKLVFAGDILLSDHVLGAYRKAGNRVGVVDGGFRQVIDGSDIFMANEEFPFSSRGTAAADKQFTFRLPPEHVSMFQELGIDIVTLANNHALDFGTDALLDTCSTLDDAGILRVGA